MLKNKIKLIAILSLIIFTLTLPIVRAENETQDGIANSDTQVSENNSSEPTETIVNTTNSTENINTEENFKKTDVYLTGDDVTIDYIIDGNLFVIANNVTINSQIAGDAFICANTLTIGEQGYVFSNLFTLSKNVTVNGIVYALYSASENTTINGYIYRDIRIGSNTVNINGTIGRNAYIDCKNLNFTSNDNEQKSIPTVITGNLTYSSSNEISIPEGIVSGETTFEKETSFDSNTIQDTIMKLVTFVVTVIAIWLLCLWLAPNFLKNNTQLLTTKKVLPVIGFGILTPIVLILLAILFFVLGITSTLGLLLIFLFFILIAISNSMFIITLNNIICEKFKIEKRITTFGMLVACSAVLWLIGLIPIVGSIIGLFVLFLGLGIAVSSLVLRKKEVTE